MGFNRRGRSLFCAQPFSHNPQFSKTGNAQRKSSTSGRAHFRSRKLEIPPSLSFSLPHFSTRRHLGASVEISLLSSSLLNPNARLCRAFWLGRDPASRIYIPSRFIWKDTFIIRPMFIYKHRDGNSVFWGAKFPKIKIFPLSSFSYIKIKNSNNFTIKISTSFPTSVQIQLKSPNFPKYD